MYVTNARDVWLSASVAANGRALAEATCASSTLVLFVFPFPDSGMLLDRIAQASKFMVRGYLDPIEEVQLPIANPASTDSVQTGLPSRPNGAARVPGDTIPL